MIWFSNYLGLFSSVEINPIAMFLWRGMVFHFPMPQSFHWLPYQCYILCNITIVFSKQQHHTPQNVCTLVRFSRVLSHNGSTLLCCVMCCSLWVWHTWCLASFSPEHDSWAVWRASDNGRVPVCASRPGRVAGQDSAAGAGQVRPGEALVGHAQQGEWWGLHDVIVVPSTCQLQASIQKLVPGESRQTCTAERVEGFSC